MKANVLLLLFLLLAVKYQQLNLIIVSNSLHSLKLLMSRVDVNSDPLLPTVLLCHPSNYVLLPADPFQLPPHKFFQWSCCCQHFSGAQFLDRFNNTWMIGWCGVLFQELNLLFSLIQAGTVKSYFWRSCTKSIPILLWRIHSIVSTCQSGTHCCTNSQDYFMSSYTAVCCY